MAWWKSSFPLTWMTIVADCPTVFWGLVILFIYLQKDGSYQVEPRLSYVEGARDVAVLDAMLESGKKQGVPVQVNRF